MIRTKWFVVILCCCCFFGTTACRRHRTPKKISFVRLGDSRQKNTGLYSHNKKTQSTTLSLVNIVSDYPSDNVMLQYTGFVVSYNTTYATPSWVAWELTSEEVTGPISRKDYDYIPDPKLESLYRIEKGDYAGSDFDRGHMCPAGDMTWSASAMNDCHYMTNICPQAPKLNQVYWESLESACRRWACEYGSIYIVCGPIYTNDNNVTIGTNHTIKVPNAFFKVVINLNKGKEQGIGFIYTNSNEHQTMEGASRTIDQIEDMTGYDFFQDLPDALEEFVETQNRLKNWR